MKNFLFLILIPLFRASITTVHDIIPVKDSHNITIAFGSCNRYTSEEDNQIFYRIAEANPDLWIWLGDVAYVDQRTLGIMFTYAGETKIRNKFNEVKNSPAYSHLRNTTNVVGVWDDHDYGLNNAGKYFKHKTLTQQLWLDFIDEPLDSPRRKRDGIYESYYVGDSSMVKVILLDVRFSKDEQSVFGGGDMLGQHQWEWLEEELKHDEARVTLIGSGTQILPDDRIFPEQWYIESKNKLIELIKKYKLSGVILLSGDVHYAEIMSHPCRERIGFDLHEFTSSGLTHSITNTVPIAEKIIDSIYPETYDTDVDRYFERNFGLVRISFEGEKPQVHLELRNYYGIKVLELNIDYEKLEFDEELLQLEAQCALDEHRFFRFFEKSFESILDLNFYPLAGIIAFIYLIATLLIVAGVIGRIFMFFWRIFNPKGEVSAGKAMVDKKLN